MEFKTGDMIFSCSKDRKTQEYCIWISEVKDVIDKYTPKNRLRDRKYILAAWNYSIDGKQEITIHQKDLLTERYSTSPTEAVNFALRHFFADRDSRSPEDKLLTVIYGVTKDNRPAAEISMQELPHVIRDLQKFYALFEEAFKLEKKLAEGKDNDKKKEEGEKKC